MPWHLALLAMLLCGPSLWMGWQGDDNFHRAALTRPDWKELSRPPAELFAYIKGDEPHDHPVTPIGFFPWWTQDGLRLAFLRPLAGLTHWLDYKLWPQLPALMHLHSLLWLGAVVAAGAFFYRRMLGGAWIAGLAALLFAVDDAHGWPAIWLANRNALMGVFFGLLTLIAHDRWRRDGWQVGAVLAPPAFLLGLLSKESAVATGAFLFAYALFLDRDRWVRRFWSLVPCALTGALWWVGYKALGYGACGSAMYVDPGASPIQFAEAVVMRAPILLLGQWFFPSDFQTFMSQRAAHVMWLTALGFLAILAVSLGPLVRRDRLARFWTVGMALAVLPACATTPSDRLLFFAGIGAMGLLAQFIAAVVEKAYRLPVRAWRRVPTRALCVLLVVVHLVMAPLALTQAAGNARRFGDVFARAAASLPSDSAVRGQELLLVSTPSYFVFAHSALKHALDGEPYPSSALVLGSGIYPVELCRQDDRTLLVRPAGGFLAQPGSPEPGRETEQPPFDIRYLGQLLDWLYRDNTPMRIGQRIELAYVTVEITALTEDGRPAEAAFRFTRELEHPSFRWLQWEDGAYVPFVLPAVGETVTLPAVTVPFPEKRG